MSKQTPGPWKWVGGTDKRLSNYIRSDARQTATCEVMQGGASYSEYQANARLIAASPEMLEACAVALQFIAEHSSKFAFKEVTPVCDQLTEAITKAEGSE